MRKFLTLISIWALGLVAIGAVELETFNYVNFEETGLWSRRLRWGVDDEGTEGVTGFYYWWCANGNASFATQYSESGGQYEAFDDETNPQPSYMKSGEKNKGYGEFRSQDPLLRTFNNVNSSGSSQLLVIPEQNHLFVDMLMQFHPRRAKSDVVPAADVRNLAKFMCWLSSDSKFVVTAGRYDAANDLYRTNYITTANVKTGVWYRVTARAIADATTAGSWNSPAFALYLDGQLVTCGEDYAIGDDRAAMDERFMGSPFYEAKGLFPAIREYKTVNPGLYGLATLGYGRYDEIGIVNNGNPFALPTAELETRIALEPAKVTNVVCKVWHRGKSLTEDADFVTNTTDEASIVFKTQPGDFLQVLASPSENYSLDSELHLVSNPNAVESVTAYQVRLASDLEFSSAEPLVLRIGTANAYFKVGDADYGSLADAMEAATVEHKPLVLKSDVTIDSDPRADNGQMRVLSWYGFTFDLAGHKLKGRHFQEEAAIYAQGQLTIIDSVGGGSIESDGLTMDIVSTNDALNVNHVSASVTLGDEHSKTSFDVLGRVRCSLGKLAIKGGRYLTPYDILPATGDPDFYLKEYLADAERFAASAPEWTSAKDCWFSIIYNDKLLVNFTTDQQGLVPTPQRVTVAEGSLITEPSVALFGHTLTNWYVQGSEPRKSWNFTTDTVTADMTLVGQLRLDSYRVTYDQIVPQANPTTYTVTMQKTALSAPYETPANYEFDGWLDDNTGHKVNAVGSGATFEGTDPAVLVSGDLSLTAQWKALPLEWSNTGYDEAESNGCYKGVWTFQIPTGGGLNPGDRVVIERIDFGIVNPLLYPKTAEALTVTNAAGLKVTSAARPDHYDPSTAEYVVSGALNANHRPKVSYVFSNLEVQAGAIYYVYLSSAAGEPTGGFLRLTHRPLANDKVFGNCSGAADASPIERYDEFCPSYEVHGHAIGK